MSWEDTLLYLAAWSVGIGIVAFIVFGLDKLYPVDPVRIQCEDCGNYNTRRGTVMYQGEVALCRNERSCHKRQIRTRVQGMLQGHP